MRRSEGHSEVAEGKKEHMVDWGETDPSVRLIIISVAHSQTPTEAQESISQRRTEIRDCLFHLHIHKHTHIRHKKASYSAITSQREGRVARGVSLLTFLWFQRLDGYQKM